jgi:hypothetical protein
LTAQTEWHEIVDVELAEVAGIYDYSPSCYAEATFAVEGPNETKPLSAAIFDDLPEFVSRA